MSSIHPYLVPSATAEDIQKARADRTGRGALALLGMLLPTVTPRQALQFIRRSAVPDILKLLYKFAQRCRMRGIAFDCIKLNRMAMACIPWKSFCPQLAAEHLQGVVVEWTAEAIYEQDLALSGSGEAIIALPVESLRRAAYVFESKGKRPGAKFGRAIGERLVRIYVSTRTRPVARRLYLDVSCSLTRSFAPYIAAPLAESEDIDLLLPDIVQFESLNDANAKSMAARRATVARCNHWRLRTLRSRFPCAADDLTALVGSFLGDSWLRGP